MKSIPLVRAGAARPFLAVLERAGAPVESLWGGAHLPIGAIEHPQVALPMRLLERFVEGAARSQGIDDLGLQAAQAGLASLAEHGQAIRGATTLADAIRQAQSGQAAWSNGDHLWVVPDGDQVRFLRRCHWDRTPSWHGDVYALKLMLELVTLVGDRAWRPREVVLQSQGSAELAHGLGPHADRLRWGCPATGFSFPRTYLARRLPPEPIAGTGARGAAPSSGKLAADLIGALSELGIPLLREGKFSIVTAAEATGTSVRTLQRHLNAQGVSFSRLLDQVRFLMATRLLDESELRVIDVAMELGYSDPAHFTRAFRRWAAVGPLEYRRSRAEGPEARRATA